MTTPIDYDELATRVADGTIALLDAQAAGWYEREHLPGAHRLDWDNLDASARATFPNPDAEIAVYCWNTTCSSSAIVAAELKRLGYRNVRRYVGGKQDWAEHGGAIVAAESP